MAERSRFHHGYVTLYHRRNIANKHFSIYGIPKKNKDNMIGFIFAIDDAPHNENE